MIVRVNRSPSISLAVHRIWVVKSSLVFTFIEAANGAVFTSVMNTSSEASILGFALSESEEGEGTGPEVVSLPTGLPPGLEG